MRAAGTRILHHLLRTQESMEKSGHDTLLGWFVGLSVTIRRRTQGVQQELRSSAGRRHRQQLNRHALNPLVVEGLRLAEYSSEDGTLSLT